MDAREPPAAFEPTIWYLVFHEKTDLWWLRWLGRFKHVSAFTYIPGARMWHVYDVQIAATRKPFYSHAEWIGAAFREWTRDAEIVKFERLPAERPRVVHRFFFFCGPAIKHLIGVRGRALRPDAIFRDVLRNGGVLIEREKPIDPGRSGVSD